MSDSDIPADVMERARSVQRELGGFNRYPSTAAIYIAQALLSERQRALEEAAKIAERDVDWTLFSRQPKIDALTGEQKNVFAGPDDDGTYPSAKNVFAYTTGIAAGRAIASAIRSAS